MAGIHLNRGERTQSPGVMIGLAEGVFSLSARDSSVKPEVRWLVRVAGLAADSPPGPPQ